MIVNTCNNYAGLLTINITFAMMKLLEDDFQQLFRWKGAYYEAPF